MHALEHLGGAQEEGRRSPELAFSQHAEIREAEAGIKFPVIVRASSPSGQRSWLSSLSVQSGGEYCSVIFFGIPELDHGLVMSRFDFATACLSVGRELCHGGCALHELPLLVQTVHSNHWRSSSRESFALEFKMSDKTIDQDLRVTGVRTNSVSTGCFTISRK